MCQGAEPLNRCGANEPAPVYSTYRQMSEEGRSPTLSHKRRLSPNQTRTKRFKPSLESRSAGETRGLQSMEGGGRPGSSHTSQDYLHLSMQHILGIFHSTDSSASFNTGRVSSHDSISPSQVSRPNTTEIRKSRVSRSDSPQFNPRRVSSPYTPEISPSRVSRSDSPQFNPRRVSRSDSPQFNPRRVSRPVTPEISPSRVRRPDTQEISPSRVSRHDIPEFNQRRVPRPDTPKISPSRGSRPDVPEQSRVLPGVLRGGYNPAEKMFHVQQSGFTIKYSIADLHRDWEVDVEGEEREIQALKTVFASLYRSRPRSRNFKHRVKRGTQRYLQRSNLVSVCSYYTEDKGSSSGSDLSTLDTNNERPIKRVGKNRKKIPEKLSVKQHRMFEQKFNEDDRCFRGVTKWKDSVLSNLFAGLENFKRSEAGRLHSALLQAVTPVSSSRGELDEDDPQVPAGTPVHSVSYSPLVPPTPTNTPMNPPFTPTPLTPSNTPVNPPLTPTPNYSILPPTPTCTPVHLHSTLYPLTVLSPLPTEVRPPTPYNLPITPSPSCTPSSISDSPMLAFINFLPPPSSPPPPSTFPPPSSPPLNRGSPSLSENLDRRTPDLLSQTTLACSYLSTSSTTARGTPNLSPSCNSSVCGTSNMPANLPPPQPISTPTLPPSPIITRTTPSLPSVSSGNPILPTGTTPAKATPNLSNRPSRTITFNSSSSFFNMPILEDTALPTRRPTPLPTRPSSTLPTRRPTPLPSRSSSTLPTRRPTPLPSRPSSTLPTRRPTPLPSRPSSTLTTRRPTPLPSRPSSTLPTRGPTPLPTRPSSTLPTRRPTPLPSRPSSTLPTLMPSRTSSKSPTDLNLGKSVYAKQNPSQRWHTQKPTSQENDAGSKLCLSPHSTEKQEKDERSFESSVTTGRNSSSIKRPSSVSIKHTDKDDVSLRRPSSVPCFTVSRPSLDTRPTSVMERSPIREEYFSSIRSFPLPLSPLKNSSDDSENGFLLNMPKMNDNFKPASEEVRPYQEESLLFFELFKENSVAASSEDILNSSLISELSFPVSLVEIGCAEKPSSNTRESTKLYKKFSKKRVKKSAKLKKSFNVSVTHSQNNASFRHCKGNGDGKDTTLVTLNSSLCSKINRRMELDGRGDHVGSMSDHLQLESTYLNTMQSTPGEEFTKFITLSDFIDHPSVSVKSDKTTTEGASDSNIVVQSADSSQLAVASQNIENFETAILSESSFSSTVNFETEFDEFFYF